MKRRFLKTVIITTFIQFINNSDVMAQSLNYLWAKSTEGSSTENSKVIATDINGNAIVVGDFTGSSITISNNTLTNKDTTGTSTDIYLVKYDNNGNVVWANAIGGTTFDQGQSVATDESGNIVVVGNFSSPTLTIDAITLTNANNSGNMRDIFVAKYQSNGNLLWAKRFGDVGAEVAVSATADKNGNIIITGHFWSSTFSLGTTTHTNAGETDFFLLKLDPMGNIMWSKSTGNLKSESGNSVKTDANGNIIVFGTYNSESLNFGNTSFVNQGETDMFLIKLDSLGNYLWLRNIGGTKSESANGIALDANGDVYVTGAFNSPSFSFGGITINNESGNDVFVAKYNNLSGFVQWVKSAGGSGFDVSNSIAVDANANVYIVGSFNSSNFKAGTFTLSSNANSEDIFIAKYSSIGNVLWATSIGGNSYERAFYVDIDRNSNLFLTGHFGSSTLNIGSINLNNTGEADGLTMKFNETTTSIANVNDIELSVFPNPVHSELILKNLQSGLLEVYTFEGKLMASYHINTTNYILNVNQLSEGIYYLRLLYDNGKVYHKKFIKE